VKEDNKGNLKFKNFMFQRVKTRENRLIFQFNYG
jgi:hypothetical protein